jgi:hypothetical protein
MADVLQLSLRPSERYWQGLTLARKGLPVSQINNRPEDARELKQRSRPLFPHGLFQCFADEALIGDAAALGACLDCSEQF